MTLTTAQRLRLKISDAPHYADETRYGDGTAQVFVLPYVNITAASAYVPIGGTAWSATGCAFNPSGTVSFSGVISANSAWRYSLRYSVFSDDEIDDFLTIGGTVLGGALEALGSMMFDATRAAAWEAADGSSFDNRSAQQHLRELYDKLQQEQQQEATTAGGQSSWSVNQGDY